MANDRGFNKLKGKLVKAVDAESVNQVLLLCDDGTVFELNAELGPSGLPVISVERRKEKLEKLPRKQKQATPSKLAAKSDGRPFEEAWPFPKSEKEKKKVPPPKKPKPALLTGVKTKAK